MEFQKTKPLFIKKFIKDFILRSDMFAAQPTLRYGGQSSYETSYGGCLSILMVVGFAAIFYTSFINVLRKVNVTASTDVQDDPFGIETITNIELAIGIDGLDCTAAQRYFEILLETSTVESGVETVVEVSLEPCQKSTWLSYDYTLGNLFDAYGMAEMLCPTSTSQLTLQGFQASAVWKKLEVRVQKCDNSTAVGYTCYPQADIDTFFDSYTQANDFFKVELYVLDTELSPTHTAYLTKIIEKQIFVSFSHNIGTRGVVRLGHYEVITDSSIWPFPITKNETGHYLESYDTHMIELYSTHYVKIEVEKSRKMYSVSRGHDKFDEVLSYVGGLFALVFGFLFFFIGSFSEYRYEISVAENNFCLEEGRRQVRQKEFGFLKYLQYAIYDWLRAFNVTVDWPQMEEIDKVRAEVTEQMDVRYLLKQLQHCSNVNKLLVEENRLLASLLMRRPSLDEVKMTRKISQYYDKIMTNQAHSDSLDIKDSNGTVANEAIIPSILDEQECDSDDEKAEDKIVETIAALKQQNDPIYHQIPAAIRERLAAKHKQMANQMPKKKSREIKIESGEISCDSLVKSRQQLHLSKPVR